MYHVLVTNGADRKANLARLHSAIYGPLAIRTSKRARVARFVGERLRGTTLEKNGTFCRCGRTRAVRVPWPHGFRRHRKIRLRADDAGEAADLGRRSLVLPRVGVASARSI